MDPLENTENYTSQPEEDKTNTEFDELMRQQQEYWDAQQEAEALSEVSEEVPAESETGDKTQQALQQAEELGEFPVLSGVMDTVLDFITPGERDEEADSQRVAGKGGDERNPFDAVLSRAADWVDNTFDGDQRSLEEIQEKMDTTRAEKKQRDAEAPALQRALSEPGRALTGSFLGAAESGLEFAELIGDTAKTLASKVNIVGYDPADDPFSDQYNWASWNLGKDDIGAQTGVGKITQGFGEFAVTFTATGGGKAAANLFAQGVKQAGVRGAAAAAGREALEGVAADMIMAASGEGNLSNLIKENAPEWYPTFLTAIAIDEDDNPFEAAFKTALEGGMLGAPIGAAGAFIKGAIAGRIATAENLKPEVIRQRSIEAAQKELFHGTSKYSAKNILSDGFQPSRNQIMPGEGVYFAEDPRYASAYAYDDADGSVIPGAPDPEGAVLGGNLPAGTQILDIPTTGLSMQDFARKKGLKNKTEIVRWAKENGYDGIRYDPEIKAKPGEGGAYEYFIFDKDVANQVVAGDPMKFTKYTDAGALRALRNMERVGIQPTWDDVAQVVPTLFTPGPRVIEAPEFHPEAMNKIMGLDPTNPNAMAIVDPFTGMPPERQGAVVNIDGAKLDKPADPEAVIDFIGQYYDILTRDDVFLRSTLSNTTGKPQVELVRQVSDVDDAIQLGKSFDQESVFRLDNFEYVKTGGFNQLFKTQGANLQAISTRPVRSTPVSPQKAATQQIKAEQQLSSRGGSQNMLTDNQIRRLGDAGPTRTTELLEELVNGNQIDVSELAKEARMTELEVVQEAASKLGDDFDLIAADVSKLDLNAEGYLSRTGIVQSRMVMKELASRLSQAVFKANDATAKGMNTMNHVEEMVGTLKAFMKVYKVSANLNSKRLSAGAIELPPEFGVPGNRMENLYGAGAEGIDKQFDASMKMLDKMSEGLKGNNPKARQQALRIGAQLELLGDQPFKLAQGISTLTEIGTKYALKVMYNSMLSAPATHFINGLSNFTAVVMRPMAAAVGGDIKSKKAAIASFDSLRETLSDALEMAGKQWKATGDAAVKGIDTSTSEASIALEELAKRAEELGDTKMQIGAWMMQLPQFVAEFPGIGLPSRLLSTSDEFFKTAIQRMEYKRITMEQAIEVGGNDVQAVFKEYLEKNKNLNFTKSGESLNKELNRIAKEVTFQQNLEGTAKKFGEWVESYPALRVFFPFVRTGHNVASYTASYVPLLAQAMEAMGTTKFAELPPYEQAVVRGRQWIGSAFIASAGLLAANGMLTGNGPMEFEARKRWLEQNQPRSLKFGDTFISLDRLEPFGPILSAVADIHYAVTNGDMKKDRASWMFGYLTHAMAVNMTDRTFFQGFQDMAKFISPRGQNGADGYVKFFAETGNNLIPAAGLRRALTNMMNPYMQEFNEQWDRTLFGASLGTLGETATKYDFITGEPIGSMSGGINSLLPIKIRNIKQDPVKQALMEIEYNSDQIIEELGRTGVKLTPAQISRLQKHMGDSSLRKQLEDIVTAPDWKNAVKAYKEKLTGSYRVAKTSQLFYREIHDTISLYADDALELLKEDYPELDNALNDYQENASQDRYGGLTDYHQQ